MSKAHWKWLTLEAVFLEKIMRKNVHKWKLQNLYFGMYFLRQSASPEGNEESSSHHGPALPPRRKLNQKSPHQTNSCQCPKAKDSILPKYFALKSTESQALKIAGNIFANLIRLLWDAHGHTEHHQLDLDRQEVGVGVKKSTCELPSSGKPSFDGSQWEKPIASPLTSSPPAWRKQRWGSGRAFNKNYYLQKVCAVLYLW